jgi:hypothetical protein
MLAGRKRACPCQPVQTNTSHQTGLPLSSKLWKSETGKCLTLEVIYIGNLRKAGKAFYLGSYKPKSGVNDSKNSPNGSPASSPCHLIMVCTVCYSVCTYFEEIFQNNDECFLFRLKDKSIYDICVVKIKCRTKRVVV